MSHDAIHCPKASEAARLTHRTAKVLSRLHRRLLCPPYAVIFRPISSSSSSLSSPTQPPWAPCNFSNRLGVLLPQGLCEGCSPAWNSLFRYLNGLPPPLLQPLCPDSGEHFGPFFLSSSTSPRNTPPAHFLSFLSLAPPTGTQAP